MSDTSRLLIIVSMIFCFTQVKGGSPFASFQNRNEPFISSFSTRFLLGTQLYTNSRPLRQALADQSLFDSIDDVFATTGVTVGLGAPDIPNLKNVIAGVSFIYLFTQPQYKHSTQSTKSMQFHGNSYGLFIEYQFALLKRLDLDLGFRFLKNRLNMDIDEHPISNDPSQIFDGSRSLDLEYKTNSVNPYLIIDYKVIALEYFDFSAGCTFDYQYTLPVSIWKLTKSDVYNEWTFKNSGNVVDLPSFGDHTFGMGIFLTARTYF